MKNEIVKIQESFAAANGYSGFKSYFDTIFNPSKFEQLYILKGGPGTGKSSFMKKLLNEKSFSNFKKEAIYCSSDPKSLDGIIIDERVAVIDGTAPHECDPKLPGAVDEIINLGENWDVNLLKNRRDEIAEINNKKKRYYKSAYKYLSFCENINNYILKILSDNYCFNKAEKKIEEITSITNKEKKSCKIRLVSSFGKNGYHRLDNCFGPYKSVYKVSGIFGSDSIFLGQINNLAEEAITIYPSPFSMEKFDAVSLDSSSVLFASEIDTAIENIKTEEYLKLSHADVSEMRELENVINKMLKYSENYFRLASDEHFKLEDIYSSAMKFSKNDELYQSVYENFLKILVN